MTTELTKAKDLKVGEFFGRVSGQKTTSSSLISEVVHDRQRDIPKHTHELAFFSLLLSGSYSESYKKKTFTYSPMTIWWHPSGVSHKDEIGKSGGKFFVVDINSKTLENLQEYAPVPEAFYEKSTPLVWLASRLYHEFKSWQTCSEFIAEGLTLEMLAYSARKEIEKERQRPRWLLSVIEKLNEEFNEKPSTGELAREVGVHPVHLAAVFRKFHKQTIGEYVQNLRVVYASELLLNGEIPLAEIAVSAGFSDQSHFTRVFKRVRGITPGAFRKSSS